jgi:preprotein translocase subunit SecE
MAVAKEKEKQPKENPLKRFTGEVGKVRAELRKVVWPTREEATRLTVVVILISVAIGLFLFIGDSVFFSLYSTLTSLIQ